MSMTPGQEYLAGLFPTEYRADHYMFWTVGRGLELGFLRVDMVVNTYLGVASQAKLVRLG